jgi:hypothetical protein
MLAVERVDRSDEPLAGKLYAGGEANELVRFTGTGVSLMDGVSFVLSSIVLPGVSKSVCIVRPASAGILDTRWASGGWLTPVSIVGRIA